jgi:uncharacterized protein YkwD
MGEPGDRGDVPRAFSLILAALSLLSLTAAPAAVAAIDLQGGKAMERPARAASASPLIAPPGACPNQTTLEVSAPDQEQAMRCMTDFARRQAGLPSLAEAEALDISAREKTLDILRCDSFSHFACGRDFTYWMQETGYTAASCWRAGENLAWGIGEQGTVRSIFRALMRSPTHRRNILGDYSQIGVGVEAGTLAGRPGAFVWTQHFGSHCDASPAQA